jgi:alkanesulfonate monooxygenase SsuD/methylene tetrahydromethanopterin reductase-like flavin-dependent oxidoreductase (luciferase family)
MKFFFFHLMPYGALDLDYDKKHEAAYLTLPNSYYDPKKGHELYHRYLDELVMADGLGYDGVCVNEHHQTAYGMMPAPNVLAGALARETKTATLCVLGRALPIISEPLTIAEEFAMLDNLVAGRFIAGFVRGLGTEYHTTMAIPGFSHERFHEAHDLIIRAWTEIGPFEFAGKHFHYQYVNIWPRPYQSPHPPVWVPSQGSAETIAWAAHPDRRYTYLITFSPVESVKFNMAAYRKQAEDYGYTSTPAQLGWAVPLYVSDTDGSARREAKPHIEAFFNKFLKAPPQFKAPPGYTSAASYKRLMQQKYKVRQSFMSMETLIDSGMFVCGSPDTVAATLEQRQAELGFENLVAIQQFGTLPGDLTEKGLRLFSGEVMPRIRHLGVTAPADTPAPAPVGE